MALGGQLLAQLAEILDNAVMDHRDPVVGVRVGIVFVGAAMRRPAGVAEADVAGQRRFLQFILQIAQLAAGPQPRQPAVFQRGDARRIIAAIFQTLQRVDKSRRHGLAPQNSYNAAHS